jgi:two-component system vancomycin resistance associated response regulator VraR
MKNNHELTVLIIDEHTGVPKLLAERLGRVPGIQVIGETANVMLGAELAHQFEPDVILADFRRAGPPRAETYRWLCRISPSSRVIAHTSYLPHGDERALREAGVTRCILKGGNVAQLAEQILDLARSDGRPSPAPAGNETRNAAPIA